MAEDLIPHNEAEEGAVIVAITPDTVENNHTSAPKANANFVTPVTNGTTETKKQNFPKTVTGPTEVKSGEKLEYIISEYEVNNDDTLDKDKQRMRWCFYIDGVKLDGSKKHVQIKNSENQKEDVGDNFLIIDNAAMRTLAIENDAYLYAKAEVVEEDGEKNNKLTIVFSKWLDGKKVNVEAFRNRPDHKPKKGYVVTATVTAKPEVININWVNAKEEPIKFAGYDQDVFLQVETIGMKDKELNLDILDYDKGGKDDKLDWGANSIKITGRKTLKQFPIKKKAQYGLQEKDENKPGLDLFVVVNSSEPLENCKDKYATYLDLNPDEKIITAYFAEERKKEVQKGEELSKPEPKKEIVEKPKEITHTVKKGDVLYSVAKKYGVSHHKVLKEYNNLTSNSLKVGQVLKIPPKEEKEKPKEKEEKKDSKTITYYQKIDSASLGSEVHLTAEAQNLEGKTVSFKVFEKEPILLTEKETPLPLLVDKEEKTEAEAKVSDGKAQISVILKRKDKEAHQQWKDILSPPDECIDGVWYDSKKDQDVKMKDDDKRIIDEPDRYTPAIKHQEKKKTYLWLQVTCEGDQLDFDQPFLKKSGALEVDYSDRAPWMVFAKQELDKYGGVRQNESPLKEQINLYFSLSSHKFYDYKGNWCAAYINWCFEQTEDYKSTNPKINVAAYDWLTPSLAKKKRKDIDGWLNGEIISSIDDAFVGAVIVFSHSHVAFVLGQSEDGKSLIYLGGNQSDGATNDGPGKRTLCTNPKLKTGINKSFWLIKPKNYTPTSSEKNLPKISPDGKELSYEDTHG
ncbi:LysM peptidoglycan-binding domain-containing protein [uncultured Aquimarina sp.]|uniref:LysM peptidoglycan-binding domain-containing protein n=1 Tax=uncultured Aquimarina sp. TaxID=575652 RepID=UPI0026200D02|nr:LysM peptidoglycan-binding domain-containing protein [uncultured Aquimarina sp.]